MLIPRTTQELVPAVPASELKSRLALELFRASRESAPGAALSVLAVMFTQWGAQSHARLLGWVAAVLGLLLLRAFAAQHYLSSSPANRLRLYRGHYAAQWATYLGSALVWVLSLNLLGSGSVDLLFFMRLVFVSAVVSFYLSVIGIDRWLYFTYCATFVIGIWVDLALYYPEFLEQLPSTPLVLAVYAALLLSRSSKEQTRLRDAIVGQLTQELLLGRLEVQATRDALTGVNNRGRVEEELRRLIKVGERHPGGFSVLLLDVDHFKDVNDRHGHDVGDRVLCRLTEVAAAALREIDVLGRWGGEEFLVLLPGTPLSEALMVAERLREAIARVAFAVPGGAPFRVTVSIGVAQYQAGDSGDTVAKHADVALYMAKGAGRNSCRTYAPVGALAA